MSNSQIRIFFNLILLTIFLSGIYSVDIYSQKKEEVRKRSGASRAQYADAISNESAGCWGSYAGWGTEKSSFNTKPNSIRTDKSSVRISKNDARGTDEKRTYGFRVWIQHAA